MADEVPAFDDIPSFDDLPDAPQAQAAAPSNAVPRFDDIPAFDDLPESGRPAPEGPFASGLREAAHAVIPAVAGTVAAGVGGALGTAALPGPGTMAGGVAGFVGGSMGADYLQEKALNALGFDDSQQRAANQEANPKSSFIGGLAPAVATMNPMGVGETIAKQAVQRGAGAAMMGGFEAGSEAVQGEDLSPFKIGGSMAIGAIAPGFNKFGQKLSDVGEHAVQRAGKMIPGRPGRTANPDAAQAHADVDDPNAEVDWNTSSFAPAGPDRPQPTTGNPQSAPARSARDYGKDKAPVTPENDMLSQGDVAPDTAAALAADQPAPAPVAGNEPAAPAPQQAPAPEPAPQPQAPVEPPAPNVAQPPAAAAAINASKRRTGLPERSVDAGFPKPEEPVAVGENEATPMPEIKGRAAEPIGGQKEAGNYLKGRTQDFGKNIAIETHAGQERSGTAPDGTPWKNTSPYDYGYFNKTIGKDKDHVDFARPHPEDVEHLGDKHFVVDQKNADTGKFDEHKVFSYYKDEAAARDHFGKGFSDGADRLGAIKEASRGDLVKLLAKATKKAWNKPYSMADATAPKTAEPKVVAKARELLAEKGMNPADLDKLPPEQRAVEAAKFVNANISKTGNVQSAKTVRIRPKPPEVAGLLDSEGRPVTARTKPEAEAKSAQHKKVEDWFEETKPPSQMDPALETDRELLTRIKTHPYPAEGWVPAHKPASWLLASEARKLQTKPTPGNLKKFRDAERMLRGSPEDVKNYRDGKRIKADIENSRRSGDDAVANAEAKNIDNGRNSVEDDMIAALDAKRTPVNNAADIKAAEKNIGKAKHIDDSSLAKVDTKALDAAGLRKLEAAKLAGRRSEKANVPSEDRPASPKREIKLDDNERQKIMDAMEKATKKAASRDPSLDATAPIEKGVPRKRGDLMDMVDRFANDERGSVGSGQPVDWGQIKANIRAALKTTDRSSYKAKEPQTPHDEYINSLEERLHKLNQEGRNHAQALREQMAAMPKELDAGMRQRIYDARDADSAHFDMPYKQPGKTNIESLPTREQALYNQHLKPVFDESNQFVQNIRAIKPAKMGPEIEHHISHITKGDTDKYNVLNHDDPTQPSVNGLRVNADSAKDRRFFAMVDAKTGDRHVIQVNPEKGTVTKWDKYKRETIKDPNFAFEDGKTVTVGKPGNAHDYVLRNATAAEIEKHALGLDGKGKPMKYFRDAGFAAMMSHLQLGDMARNMQELHNIAHSNDPAFSKLVTSNPEKARELGWEPTKLPNFPPDQYMHPDLKAVFDDFAGHKGGTLADLNNWVTKALFWMPTAHINNVGTHWFVGRGGDWVNPMAYKRLIQTLPAAIKSVVNQDHYQRQMREAGAGTVYGSTITKDMVGQIGKAFQQDVKKNPAEWNVMAKTLGFDLGDMAKAVYDHSSHAMWSVNDMFLTQRVMELEKKGLSMKQAIIETERDIPNYRVPIKVIGSGEKGRLVAQAMKNPLWTSFGRYHYGMMNSYANIAKDAFHPDSTAGDRLQAAGKIMAMGLLATMIYPAFDKLSQLITGNDDAEQQRRGPISIPYHLYNAFNGKEDAMAALRSTLTLPPLTTSMLEMWSNKDFRGKDIIAKDSMKRLGEGSVGAGAEVATQFGEHLARGLVSPLNTLETAARKGEPGEPAWRGPVRAVVDQAADVKDPTQKAVNYNRMQDIRNIRDQRTRDKNGGNGIFEGALRKLTKD